MVGHQAGREAFECCNDPLCKGDCTECRIRSARNLRSTERSHHIVESGYRLAQTGQRRAIVRMGVDHGAPPASLVQACMDRPFASRNTRRKRLSRQICRDEIFGTNGAGFGPGGTDQHVIAEAYADVAGTRMSVRLLRSSYRHRTHRFARTLPASHFRPALLLSPLHRRQHIHEHIFGAELSTLQAKGRRCCGRGGVARRPPIPINPENEIMKLQGSDARTSKSCNPKTVHNDECDSGSVA